MEDIDNKEKYTEEFWGDLEEENPELLEFILGFVESIPKDDNRTFFLDGLWTMYCLVKRELELSELEEIKI